MKQSIVLGTRGSELALTQSNQMADLVRQYAPGVEVRVEIIRTKGDNITDVPLSKIGGKGLFTKELEVALLDGRADFAVHSLKDVPTELPEGLAVAAIPAREDPRDALVSREGLTFAELPKGAKVGTSSLRRQAQLLAKRPDLQIVDLRGNVPTRIQKMKDQELDAIILAGAGLRRLGLADVITELLPPDVMLPAVGQGALGIEIRGDDDTVRAMLAPLHDPKTAAEVQAERALLAGLGGGCQVPIGARATVDGDALVLEACVCAPDGSQVLRQRICGRVSEAADLGQAAAKALLRDGAAKLMAMAESGETDQPKVLAGTRVVVTRPRAQADGFVHHLESLGADVVEFPTIEVKFRAAEGMLAGSFDWILFTSANGVTGFLNHVAQTGGSLAEFRNASICAVGGATAKAARDQGFIVSLMPEKFVAEDLFATLAAAEGGDLAGKRMLLPRGNQARPDLPDALRARGAEVHEIVVYDTVAAPISPDAVKAIIASTPDIVTFTSSSTARNFYECFDKDELARVKECAVFAAIGPVTSKTANALGLDIAIEPAQYDTPSFVQAIVDYVKEKKGR